MPPHIDYVRECERYAVYGNEEIVIQKEGMKTFQDHHHPRMTNITGVNTCSADNAILRRFRPTQSPNAEMYLKFTNE